jgi:hypothetical protein
VTGNLAIAAMPSTVAGPDDPALSAGEAGRAKTSKKSLRGLDWLNFFLADVQSGVGPFLAIYLAAAGWNEQTIGVVLTGGGIAGIVAAGDRDESDKNKLTPDFAANSNLSRG